MRNMKQGVFNFDDTTNWEEQEDLLSDASFHRVMIPENLSVNEWRIWNLLLPAVVLWPGVPILLLNLTAVDCYKKNKFPDSPHDICISESKCLHICNAPKCLQSGERQKVRDRQRWKWRDGGSGSGGGVKAGNPFSLRERRSETRVTCTPDPISSD